MPPMKIAFLVNDFPSYTQMFILNQITGLADMGYHVDIFAKRLIELPKPNPKVRDYDLLKRVYLFPVLPKGWIKRCTTLIAFIIKYRAWRRSKVLLNCFNFYKFGKDALSLRLIYNALPFFRHGQYDIIHCQFGMLGPLASDLLQAKVISGKLVTSFRGYDTLQYVKKFPNIYDNLFKLGSLFLPVSHSFKKWLVDQGCPPENIHVFYSGIELRHFEFNQKHLHPQRKVMLVSIGRLVEKKGFRFAIIALSQLIEKGYQVNYTIIGHGPLEEELKALSERLGVKHLVKFTGWLSHEETIRYLNQGHIMLTPSITSENGDKEGIPNVLKEAMALGLPVVSTFHSGIPELINNNESGFLVEEGDANALADRIAFLIDHPDTWRKFSQNGRKVIEQNFDSIKLNKKLLTYYTRLL
jgi:colanic acid/amylovoran biosynthesis glycosyltransferase